MAAGEPSVLEQIQQIVARLLATSPAGHQLFLIGGFRYRLLDHSARMSRDIDYHWEGDLDAKQAEVVALLQRRLLPRIRRQLSLAGDVHPAGGPEAQSPMVRTIELAFWKPNVEYSRIEVPLEITRIICLDPPAARTISGVVYPTASDADLIEAKVIALLNRRVIEHRDLCDLFLFSSHLVPDAPDRLRTKLSRLGVSEEMLGRRLGELRDHSDYHVRAIDAVINGDLDAPVAASIRAAGGGRIVLETVRRLLADKLHLPQGGAR